VNPTTSASSGDTTAPTVPGGLTVVLTGRNSVLVRWNHSTDTGGSGLKGYKVYRGGSVVSGSNPITAASFAETGLAYNTQYAYKVEAWDNNNNVSSQTGTVNITTAGQLLFGDEFNRFDMGTLGSPWTVITNDNLQVANSDATNVWDGTADWAAAYINPGTDSFVAGITLKNVGWSPSPAGLLLYRQGDAGYRALNSGELEYCTDLGTDSSCTFLGGFSTSGYGVIEVTTNASTGTISINGTTVVTGEPTGQMTGAVGFMIKDAHYSTNTISVVQNFWLVAP
jgi:hypothetical protein